jgi:lipid A disaccharide synthetase
MVRDVVGSSIRFVGLNGPQAEEAGETDVKMRMVSVLGLVLVLVVLFR